MTNIPIAETCRLVLETLTLDDADLMLSIWNDPDFHRFVGDRGIRTIEEAHVAMKAGVLKLYEDYGYGPYRLVRKDDGQAVGLCGLFRRDALKHADIGYSVLPAYARQGFAFEAGQAVIKLARNRFQLDVIKAIISPLNRPSIALAEKLGFTYESLIRLHEDEDEVNLYHLDLESV
ncbi:MAG: GNAT family N-acetyltransferase [Pseudomonadota bacterium]